MTNDDSLCPAWPTKYGIRCTEHGHDTWTTPDGGSYYGLLLLPYADRPGYRPEWKP